MRRRVKACQTSMVERLEDRTLLTVSFEFVYEGAITSGGIGFEDGTASGNSTLGQQRRDALQQAATLFGSYFDHTATVSIAVISQDNPNSSQLASSTTNFGPDNDAQNGFGNRGVVGHKILNPSQDLNGSTVDGEVIVNWANNWALGDTIASDQVDFTATIVHELAHAMGFSSDIVFSGEDSFGTPVGQAGAWRPFDQFLSDSTGTPIINNNTFIVSNDAWTQARSASSSPGGGLFFNGPKAIAANNGQPVGLYSPTEFLDGSSFNHVDDENSAIASSDFVMIAGSPPGKAARSFHPIEMAIFEDLGFSMNQDAVLIVDTNSGTIDGDVSGGNFSLPEAVALANSTPGRNIIQFDPSLSGRTITLDGSRLSLTDDVTIVGLGAENLTVSGNFFSQVFFIGENVAANISGLTITKGSNSVVPGFDEEGDGGGIENFGTLTLVNSVVTNNLANDFGAGISNSGTLNLVGSTVSNNTAEDGGGLFTEGEANISRSTFANNTTRNSGGAIANGGSLWISNSTISGNEAEAEGGGIGNSATLVVANSTITNNRANRFGESSMTGGGIDNGTLLGGSSLTIHNSIVAGNFQGASGSDAASDLAESGNFISSSSSFNLIGTNANLTNITNGSNNNMVGTTGSPLDPGLADLASNGGPTQTHALLAGSLAIDAGNNAAAIDDFETIQIGNDERHAILNSDQRGNGFSRYVDGDGNQSVTVDIGAFEANGMGVVNTAPVASNDSFEVTLTGSQVVIAAPGVLSNDFDADLDSLTAVLDNGPSSGILSLQPDGSFTFQPAGIIQGSLNVSFTYHANDGKQDGNTATVTLIVNSAGGGDADLEELDETLGFSSEATQFFDVFNANEKWLRAANGDWHFLLPDGSLLRWDGSNGSATGSLVANVGAEVYADPSLLYDAFQVNLGGDPAVIDEMLGFSSEATSFFNYGGQDDKWLQAANGDWYFLLPNGNLGLWNGARDAASGMIIATLSSDIYDDPSLLFNAFEVDLGGDPEAIDQELGFSSEATSSFNYGGQNDKWLQAANGDWYFLLPSGNLGLWNGARNSATGTIIATLGSEIYNDPSLLFNAGGVTVPGKAQLTGPTGTVSSRPTITWNAVSGATFYDMWIDNLTTNEEQVVREQNIAATSFTIASDLSGGNYRVWVRAGNSAGLGDWSSPRNFTVESTDMGGALVVDEFGDASDGLFGTGQLSLREAITLANANSGPDIITFSPSLSGEPIFLSGSQLDVSDDVQIIGLGADRITIDGDGASRVLSVESGTTVHISGVTISGGQLSGDDNGAGILNRGTLTLDAVVLSGNSTASFGGGIDNSATLNIMNSTITGNSALDGGGLFTQGATGTAFIAIVNSTFSGNNALRHGGGISNLDNMTILNSTIVNNRADSDGSGSGFGGGIDNIDGIELELHNTIVANNVHGIATGMQNGIEGGIRDDIATQGNTVNPNSSSNLIGVDTDLSGISNGSNGNQIGTSATPLDPGLEPGLNNNGGPTPTHALLVNSPAIDAGDNSLTVLPIGGSIATDQRGFVRIADGITVDIGAYESNSTSLVMMDDLFGFSPEATEFFDEYGELEKWIQGRSGSWFFILPDGSLVEWDGSGSASGVTIAHVGPAVYANPALLAEAFVPAPPLESTLVDALFAEGELSMI